MNYVKRQGSGAILMLGTGAGQINEVEGKLVAVRPSPVYAGNFLYDIEQTNGETVTVGGTAALNMRLNADDVGASVLIRYCGEGVSKTGAKFKDIEVLVDAGDEPNF